MTATPDQPTATDTAREGLRAAVEALAAEWEQTAEQETADIGFRKQHHRDWPKITDLRAVLAAHPTPAPDQQVIAAVLAAHEHEYERRCYPAHACSCGEWDGAFDDDGGPDDGQNDTADAYRAHVAAAVAAALHAGGSHEGGGGGE